MKDSKYNILFSNSIGKSKWGGGEKWMITAAKNLSLRGHNVIVAGKTGSVFLERAQAAGLRTECFDIRSDFAPFKVEKLTRFYRENKIDVCILNLNKDVRVAGLAARKANVPVILARHGLKLISDKWKYKMTLKLVHGIITNSNSIREIYNTFSWMPQDKTEVIYNGLSIPENVAKIDLHEQYDIPKDHLIFGAAGRLSYQKGFDLLIKAASELKDRPFTFLIAGKGKLHMHLHNLIEKYDVAQNVKLIGFTDKPLEFLNSVDIVVMPSRFEGMPNTVLESMALGKPIIAANVNGVKELVQSGVNGFSIEPESVNELIMSISDVAEMKDLSGIGQAGIKTISEQYSIERMIDHMETYFGRKYSAATR